MAFEREMEAARQMLRGGQWAEARTLLEGVVGQDPPNVEALYHIGTIHLQQQRYAEAAEWLNRAVAAKPDMPEIHANLANALRSLGRIDDAAAALERAVALRPNYALAWSNLGAVRRQQGRLSDAVAAYRKAIALQPGFVPAFMNLGNVLKDLGLLRESAEAFSAAAKLAPANPDPLASLGGALEMAGDAAGAARACEAALRLNGRHVVALLNLGLANKRLGKPDDAAAIFRRAVNNDPNNADAREQLGQSLWDAGFVDEGLEQLTEALRLRPSPQLRVNVATLVPPVYRSEQEVISWRTRLVENLAALQRDGVKIDVTNKAARARFYIPYAGFEDREVMEHYSALYEIADGTHGLASAAANAIGAGPDERALDAGRAGRADSRIRIGFISANFRDQTVGLWTEGLNEQFSREKFCVVVISIGRHDDPTGIRIRERADEYVELSSHLPSARQAVLDAKLDVLLYADVGMEGFGYTLAMSRLAPVQCVTWGHPITSGLEAIDYFISSELAEAEDAQRNYTEKLVRLKDLPLYYHRPPPPKIAREREYFDLPEDANLYGCLQTMFKLHPAFDAVIGGVLRADPKGVLVLPRPTTANWAEVTLARLGAKCPEVMDRIKLVRRLQRDEFRALNAVCDVMLAPFPFGAGDTSLEAFALGIPIVTLPTPFLKGRFTHAMYRWMGIEDCVAGSAEQYVQIAVRLGTDRAWRESVKKKILERNGMLYENPNGVRELEAFFEAAVQ